MNAVLTKLTSGVLCLGRVKILDKRLQFFVGVPIPISLPCFTHKYFPDQAKIGYNLLISFPELFILLRCAHYFATFEQLGTFQTSFSVGSRLSHFFQISGWFTGSSKIQTC